MSSGFSDDFELSLSDTDKSKTEKTEKAETPKDTLTISDISSDFSDTESKSKIDNENNKNENKELQQTKEVTKKDKTSSSFDDDFEITDSKSTINKTDKNEATVSSKGSANSKKSAKNSFLSSGSEANSSMQKSGNKVPPKNAQKSEKDDFESVSPNSFTETENKSTIKSKIDDKHESESKTKDNRSSDGSKLNSSTKSKAPESKNPEPPDDDKPTNDNKKPEKKDEPLTKLSESMYEVPEPLQIRPQNAKKRTPIVDDKAKDEEILRLQELVVKQRHIIDTQKETIKMLMKEQITHEEIESLRAGLASKSPLLQLVAATPLSESSAMTQLKAENASLRRQMEDMENRHLSELKTLRAQYAIFNSRQMPTDGCANCRRRIRELEDQLKNMC